MDIKGQQWDNFGYSGVIRVNVTYLPIYIPIYPQVS